MISMLRNISKDHLIQKLARGGLAALTIKIGAAGLSFVMFVMLARSMTVDDYGQFGFAFSLATILATIGSFGQRSVVLRFAAIFAEGGDKPHLKGILRFGYIITLGGCIALAVATSAVATVLLPPSQRDYLFAAAILVIVLGLAEYQAHAIRAFSSMTHALLPRDILWRLAVTILSIGPTIGITAKFTASQGVLITALCLLFVTLFQTFSTGATQPWSLFRGLANYDFSTWWHASWGLWGTSVIQLATPNLTVVFLGLFFSPQETGPFFAALRTAMLLNLFLLASNMISAPLISQRFHANDIPGLQRVCTAVTAGISIPTALVFLVYFFYGDHILLLFGHGFGEAHLSLVILSLGQLVGALSGPTAQIMEMAGHERDYLRLLIATTVVSLVGIFFLSWCLGPVGASIGIAGNIVVWNALVYYWIWSKMRINPGALPLIAR